MRFVSRGNAPAGAVQLDDLVFSANPPDPGLAAERFRLDPDRNLQPFVAGARSLATFDDATTWQPIPLTSPESDDEVRSVAATTTGSALELRWRQAQGAGSSRGVSPARDNRPLSVIASPAFLSQTRLSVGDEATAFVDTSYVQIKIIDTFRLFPTLADARDEPALLTNGPRLLELVNASPRGGAIYPDEVWLKVDHDARDQAQNLLNEGVVQAEVTSFAGLRQAQDEDPLVAAGWEGILFISFSAILILSALGFLIYSYLTAQKRTLEFAVLRTMGFSRRQIAVVVGFEQVFVISLGMIAGTLMGLRLGSLMIRYMGITETGDEVLPPMLLHVNWLTIGAAWLALAVAFLLTIGIVVLLYSRLQLHRVLRIGET
jgi:hypothetical protein